ncbi:formamidopyrimidine-DNA glycosylase h2TH domain-containing protein [Hirsutella rhossiliensis]|uniref:Formamidopyrimidine-DNA glycosylase h2TH domain-containing protein n=1 Tax=Hirsutella rhossiliensis TaxID=111463 RepID=A0A9P8MYV9_9HYPO|nr:formamidopyrimidine-DNA glycosylase h2TH domain-containing protein [Hirsutella rhossiliensis]KAH0961632.1 formamidopyrimidine-DNA glycosylase h2TH domain-containing protein [Hirsutella rhossiliensis]
MPEIAEVARIVHFLRLRLVGQNIAAASAIDDPNVFGKVGTSGAAVETALRGRQVMSAGSQGKYFWIILDKPPHLVMHFGMTGWIHIKGERTAYTNYYKKTKDSELSQWPPKFWKFHLVTEGDSPVEVAFTDPRRFGRVRLVDCPGASIREHSPLVENGPDPVVDVAIFTEEYLRTKMKSRHVPIKALLLDQTTISGVGNWVADETLYHAKLHPEQYCDDFDDEAIARLYQSIRYVCQTAVDKLGDSDAFPEHWLFNYRWGKGNGSAKLPNGERLAFMTVGGRTSCYSPGVQKKTGRVTTGAKVEPIKSTSDEEADGPPLKKRRTKQVKSEIKQEVLEVDVPDGRRRSARLRK